MIPHLNRLNEMVQMRVTIYDYMQNQQKLSLEFRLLLFDSASVKMSQCIELPILEMLVNAAVAFMLLNELNLLVQI